jgi:hypothetical protein
VEFVQSVFLKPKKSSQQKNLKELKEKILSYLIRTPASISDLESLGISSKDDITTGIQILLEEGAIIVNFKNQYIIK